MPIPGQKGILVSYSVSSSDAVWEPTGKAAVTAGRCPAVQVAGLQEEKRGLTVTSVGVNVAIYNFAELLSAQE